MLISTRHRFVFVANTKSASTAIEEALGPYADYRHDGTPRRKHLPLARAERALPRLFAAQPLEGHFCFGVMREPLDWITSWFRYRKQTHVEDPLPPEMTLAEFWARDDWNIHRADGRPYLQSDLFLAEDGRCLADVILPYHRLGTGLGEICALLGLPIPELPLRNASPRHIEQPAMAPALATTLRAHFASDYALWERLDTLNAAGMARLRARAADRGALTGRPEQ